MLVQLTTGAYQTRSIIAGAQRCVNLYTEVNSTQAFLGLPQEVSPTLSTHYPTPGLTPLVQGPQGAVRGLYRANNGSLYAVIGNVLYVVTASWTLQQLGIITIGTTPVSMVDNGITLVLVDGSTNGYTVNLSTNTFGTIVDPTGSFNGADRVDYIDTFFIFNRPGSPTFFTSLSNSTTFNALYYASKTGFSDNIVSVIVMNREIWLLGERTTEVWYDAGNSNFPFARMPGVFIEQGCAAKYSVAKQDLTIFWLSADQQGRSVVMLGNNYTASRVSTHAIEEAISNYPRVSDAVGFTYQLKGHTFYVLTFPSADATWVYDITTGLWHELAWFDNNGGEHRHRAMSFAFAYDTLVCGDWQNGTLYKLDPANYTDNGAPIIRIRSFPHQLNDGKRALYRRFVADMECGTEGGLLTSQSPTLSMRYSDTRGASFGNPMQQPFGSGGQYLTQIQYRRLGMARDRIFEVSWSAPVQTALNGAYVDIEPCST